jgi:8-oxo-dGTP diphosphatase
MEQEDIDDIFIHSSLYLRNVAVDNVIFGYHDKELKILLQRPLIVDKWTVTGGYIRKTETIEEAASRIAFIRTGLKDLYLQQFHSFGNPKRVSDNGFTAELIRESSGLEMPHLMFDHKHIISEALLALRLHIAHYPIGYELLPEKFTLPEIHALYETILGKSLDERNFTKRLMATGIITKLNETRHIGAHRSPFLYKFNKKEYKKGLKTGIELAF